MKKVTKLTPELKKYMYLTAIGYDLPDEKFLTEFPHLNNTAEDLNKDRNLFNKLSFAVDKYRKIYPNKRHFSNPKTSVYYTIIEAPDEVIFVFRGTTGWISWINDTRFKQITGDMLKHDNDDRHQIEELQSMKFASMSKMNNSLKNQSFADLKGQEDVDYDSIKEYYEYNKSRMYFHTGFVLQYNSIAPQINKQIDQYLNNSKYKRVSFIGHSLGGVLAQLGFITQNIRYPEHRNRFFMTGFGTPMLGNKRVQEFTEYILNPSNDKVFYVGLEKDMFTNVPPKQLGYCPPLRNDIKVQYKKEYQHIKCQYSHLFWYYILNAM